MARLFSIFVYCTLFVAMVVTYDPSTCIKCRESHVCNPPSCFCCRDKMPLDSQKIPQMIFFTFDDAVQPQVAAYYRELFDASRRNPNGCPIKMTLFISHQNTVYSLVREFYEKGMEIASHSVNHGHPNPRTFINEAKKQKENLSKRARIPLDEIKGWRSPFLEPLGDKQPNVLQELGYEYDATLTVIKAGANDNAVVPFTLDYGWPYGCKIKPCPTQVHKGFWQIPVVTVKDYKKKHDCVYVDGCNIPPPTEELAYKFLWDNFQGYYKGNRAPMGINMHASWFYYPYRKAAMNRFIEDLSKMDDVYIVTIRQVIDWLRHPTPLSKLKDFTPWKCEKNISTAVTEATSAFDVRQKKIHLDMQQRRQRQQQRKIEQRNQWQPVALQVNRQNTDFTRLPIQPTQSSQRQDNQLWQRQRHIVREQTPNPPLAPNFPFRFWWRRPPLIGRFAPQPQMGMRPLGVPYAPQEIQRRREMELRRRQDILREQRRRTAMEEQARQEQQRQTALKHQEELKRLELVKRQKELEMQQQAEQQRLAKLKAQELKIQQDLERKRLEEIKIQTELKRQAELERQREIQQQLELQKQKELEQKRLVELEQQKEILRRKEIQIQRELEKQRVAELKRQDELKRQAEIERQNEILRQKEIQRQNELEQQRLAEINRQEELKRRAELERQNEILRQKEIQVQKELEQQRLADINRQEELKRQAEIDRQKQIMRQNELQKQRQMERQRLAEMKRQEELKSIAEIQRQQDIQRQIDLSRQKEMEQKILAELKYQTDIKRLQEMERQLLAETERQRIADIQRKEYSRRQTELQQQRIHYNTDQQLEQQARVTQHIISQTFAEIPNRPNALVPGESIVNSLELQHELQRQTEIRRHLDRSQILAKLQRQKQIESDKELLRQQEITRLEKMKTEMHTKINNAHHESKLDSHTVLDIAPDTTPVVTAKSEVNSHANTIDGIRVSSLPTKISSKAMWQVDISDIVKLTPKGQIWTSFLPKNMRTPTAKPTNKLGDTRTSAVNLFSINNMKRINHTFQPRTTNPYVVNGMYTTKEIKPPTMILSPFETTNSVLKEPVPISITSFITSSTRSKATSKSPVRSTYNPTTVAPVTLRTPRKLTVAFTNQPPSTVHQTRDNSQRDISTTRPKTTLLNIPGIPTASNEEMETRPKQSKLIPEYEGGVFVYGDNHSSSTDTQSSGPLMSAKLVTKMKNDIVNEQTTQLNANDLINSAKEQPNKTNFNNIESAEVSTKQTTIQTKFTTESTVPKQAPTTTTTPTTKLNTLNTKINTKPSNTESRYFTSRPVTLGRRTSALSSMINLPPPSKMFPSPVPQSSRSPWTTFSSSYFNNSSTKQPTVSCKQGVNCIRPNCVCKSTNQPGSLTIKDTPQIIYVSVDGSINFHTYSKMRTLFAPNRINPNGCRIKGTAFANDEGSSYRIGDVLRQSGVEVALMGMNSKPYRTVQAMERDINEQTRKIASRSSIPLQSIKGWRSPEFRTLGDDQFELLGNLDMYDSSLLSAQSGKDQPKLWPFTLDYGWNENCEIGICPSKNHPGVWEIPVTPLRGPNNTRTCKYTDGCTNQPASKQDTFNYLMENFNSYYKTNKAPFSIRLKQIWFHWHYRKNFAGLMNFLDKVLSFGDVYVVSASDVLEWVKSPTPVSELYTFKPWSC